MLQPKIWGDTSPDTPPEPVAENEPTSDIIFILDKMELLLQAVTQIKKDGRYRTVHAETTIRIPFRI